MSVYTVHAGGEGMALVTIVEARGGTPHISANRDPGRAWVGHRIQHPRLAPYDQLPQPALLSPGSTTFGNVPPAAEHMSMPVEDIALGRQSTCLLTQLIVLYRAEDRPSRQKDSELERKWARPRTTCFIFGPGSLCIPEA